MVRESMIDRSVKIVRNQRDYKRVIALRAAVDTRDVDKLIDARDERVINAVRSMAGMGGEIRIVDTSAKRFIEKVIIASAWDQRFYTVFGPPGVGKTITAGYSVGTLKTKQSDPIACVRVTEFNKSNLRFFLRDLAYNLFDDKGDRAVNDMRWKGYITYNQIKKKFATARGVVVIDEAHRLKENIFDGIRDLMDETQLSIVMLGTTEFSDRLDKQFLRRLDDRYVIPEATANDVRIFTEAYGIEVDADESKQISRRIKKLGSIGTLDEALKTISKQIRDEEFSWRDVGGGQILEALDRVMTSMKVKEDVVKAV